MWEYFRVGVEVDGYLEFDVILLLFEGLYMCCFDFVGFVEIVSYSFENNKREIEWVYLFFLCFLWCLFYSGSVMMGGFSIF